MDRHFLLFTVYELWSPIVRSPCKSDWNQNNSIIEKTNKRRGKEKSKRGKLLHIVPSQKGKMIAYNSRLFFGNFNIY